jgi:hypothetical protein
MVSKPPTKAAATGARTTAKSLWERYAPEWLIDLLALPDDGNEIVTTDAPLFYASGLVNKTEDIATFYKPDQKRKAKGKGGGQFEETGAEQKHKTEQDTKNAKAEAEAAAREAQEATEKLAATQAQAMSTDAEKKVQQQQASAHNAQQANPLTTKKHTVHKVGTTTTTVQAESTKKPGPSLPDIHGYVSVEEAPGITVKLNPKIGLGSVSIEFEGPDGTHSLSVPFPYSGVGQFPMSPVQHVDYLEQVTAAMESAQQTYKNIGGEDNLLSAEALYEFGGVLRAQLTAKKAAIESAIGAAVDNTSDTYATAPVDMMADIDEQMTAVEQELANLEWLYQQAGEAEEEQLGEAYDKAEAKLAELAVQKAGMKKLAASGGLKPVAGVEKVTVSTSGKPFLPYPNNKATTTLNGTPLHLYEDAYIEAVKQAEQAKEQANQVLKEKGQDKFGEPYSKALAALTEAEKVRSNAYDEVSIARDPDPDSTVGGLADSLNFIYKKPKNTTSALQVQEFERKLKLYEAIHGLERPDGVLDGWVNAEDYQVGEQMVLPGFVDEEGNVIDAGRFDLGAETFTDFGDNDQPIQDAYSDWYERVSTRARATSR